MLPVVDDLSHSYPDLVKKATEAVSKARRQVEGAMAHDESQGSLFPEVPETYADEIIRIAQLDLDGTGMKLEKTDKAIKIIAEEELAEDPRKDIGY